MIAVVEGFFKLSRSITDDQYIHILRNSVYSLEKAIEIKKTLETLGENWFNLKE